MMTCAELETGKSSAAPCTRPRRRIWSKFTGN
jgi:hypothetical protein